jgi:DNA-binding transcriptional ArsR family regulator
MDDNAVFRGLADATRRLMVDEFCERPEQTLYELTARLIMKHGVDMSRQAIAKHLGILEAAGLVRSEKRGRFRVLVFDREKLRQTLARWTG